MGKDALMTNDSALTEAERTELLEQYRNGHTVVVAALEGVTHEDLDRCFPGEWCARKVVHHLADSETTSYGRLRQLIAEDNPTIVGYDENNYANTLFYDRPIEISLSVLAAVRASSAELLERLDETQWARSGTHTSSGFYDVGTWLRIYAAHAHDHADQIVRARRGVR